MPMSNEAPYFLKKVSIDYTPPASQNAHAVTLILRTLNQSYYRFTSYFELEVTEES